METIEKVFEKECPNCFKILVYKSQNILSRSIKLNTLCRECSNYKLHSKKIKNNPDLWKLSCRECKKELKYKSYESFKNSERKDFITCRKCISKKNSNTESGKKRLLEIGKKGRELLISNNKTFYDYWVEKFGIEIADQKKMEWIEKMKEIGKKNKPKVGKSIYDCWVDKFGIEIADQKKMEWIEKQIINNSGENNNMFGKPSPIGSGNGWSGWYKDWYFRSIFELSYMILVIERFGIKWESGENDKWKIEYKSSNGNNRNYYTDFVLNGKYLIECKPKALQKTKESILKFENARTFCKKNNLIFKVVEPRRLTNQEIFKLYSDGLIRFVDRFEEKLKTKKYF